MRLTDADLLKEQMKSVCMGIMAGTEPYNAPLKTIDDAPTVDAKPVVRCKDCKHRPIDTSGHNYGPDLLFPDDYKCPCRCEDSWYSWMPEDDWFCANGKRSEE